MNAPHLLIWFEDGQPRACELAEVPDTLTYKGEIFRAEADYFGDVDYLRDGQNRLVGFAYYPGDKWKVAIQERLLAQSGDVRLDDGILVILLETCPYEFDSMAAMGTEIYRSSTNEIMLSVPNWDFGELAFQLTTTDTPLNSGVPHKR